MFLSPSVVLSIPRFMLCILRLSNLYNGYPYSSLDSAFILKWGPVFHGYIGWSQLAVSMHCLHWHCGISWPQWVNDNLGWGLLSQFSPFCYFPIFSEWSKQWLPLWYQVHIWQVSPQLSCGDTWQIWIWLKLSDLYFCQIKISRNGEISERSLGNPHPRNDMKEAIES